MSNRVSDQTIRVINPNNIVENGALIVVCGAPKSGKTCVVENAIYYLIDSFLTTKFPPLYYGKSAEFGSRYFGKLFNDYLSHSDANSGANERRATIWQLGYQQECDDAQFLRQGTAFLNTQLPVIVPRQQRPQLLFYFDNCDTKENIDYASRCLAQTVDHRAKKAISIIETTMMLYLGLLRPQMLIFTSRLDKELHVAYFMRILKCTTTLANDLIETANTFIEPCRVALVINLNQWQATEQKRGLFIYEYQLIPPLDEQLATRKRTFNNCTTTSSSSESVDGGAETSMIQKQYIPHSYPNSSLHRRRRHRHRRRRSSQQLN